MRLRATLFAVIVLAGALVGAWKLAEAATDWYEAASSRELAAALAAAEQPWASAEVDGLRVTLRGAAPDESSRFRALEAARQVNASVEDATTVAAAAPLPPPPLALELLRNDDEISLIGLVPETGGRDVIRAALGAGGLGEHVTDMLEASSDPAPDGWREALGFGLSVLAELPRAKISVEPGRVAVIAVADSDADRASLETRLRRAAPQGIRLALDVTAPRPVIAPFAFDVSLADGGGRIAACSADSPEAAAGILAAARAAGIADPGSCRIGLGAPSPEWAVAVKQGLAALTALGGGRFQLSDLAATLTPPDGVAAARLAEVAAGLDTALPAVFELETIAPPPAPDGTAATPAATPRFEADLAEDGAVALSGPVKDATSQAAILSYASALFGHDRVADAMRVDQALPEGWPGRVLAGVEALAALEVGTLTVTPEQVALRGWGLEPDIAERVRAMLDAKLGSAARVDVTFNFAAAAAAAAAARPRPEICADQISAILETDSIQFAAGSATIVPESKGVIAAIADVLRGCPGADFEIGGHTDAQGSPAANRTLSRERAEAVLAALRDEDLPLVQLVARGYGADDPVGDNATDVGRARNRRIEFTLVDPDSAAAEVAGADADAEEAAAAADECATRIHDILAAGSIQFAPGSATIVAASEPVIAEIDEALQGCPDAGFEIGGHTDAQGSDSGNLRLSEERAEAVLAALRSEELPLPAVTAKGYGASRPIADNATAEGRAANRRIEFTPVASEEPAGGEAAVPESPDAVCGARIEEILAGGQIQFATSAATIAPESQPIIDAIADALRGCPDVAIEIGGHTDSMGSDSGNQRLSQARADAVLAALRAKGLTLPAVTAHGYGEADPVGDNATAEGRAQNRRIAFNLVTAEGDAGEEGDAGAGEAGTGDVGTGDDGTGDGDGSE